METVWNSPNESNLHSVNIKINDICYIRTVSISNMIKTLNMVSIVSDTVYLKGTEAVYLRNSHHKKNI